MHPVFADLGAGGIKLGRDDVVQAVSLGDGGAGQGAIPAVIVGDDLT